MRPIRVFALCFQLNNRCAPVFRMVDAPCTPGTLCSYRVRHAPCDMRTSACKSVFICLFRKTFLASPGRFFAHFFGGRGFAERFEVVSTGVRNTA